MATTTTNVAALVDGETMMAWPDEPGMDRKWPYGGVQPEDEPDVPSYDMEAKHRELEREIIDQQATEDNVGIWIPRLQGRSLRGLIDRLGEWMAG